MTYLVAAVSVETGIAPNDLLEAPPGIFDAMLDVLKRRQEESKKAARRR